MGTMTAEMARLAEFARRKALRLIADEIGREKLIGEVEYHKRTLELAELTMPHVKEHLQTAIACISYVLGELATLEAIDVQRAESGAGELNMARFEQDVAQVVAANAVEMLVYFVIDGEMIHGRAGCDGKPANQAGAACLAKCIEGFLNNSNVADIVAEAMEKAVCGEQPPDAVVEGGEVEVDDDDEEGPWVEG